MSRWARIMNEHWTQKGGKMVAKLQFKTLNDAIRYIEEHHINSDIYHPYVCSECGQWHIGHHKKKKLKKWFNRKKGEKY